MAALPAHRLLAYAPPFTHTGLDFFGHYFVTVHRRPAKRWVCLYTCMVTRAVHLELCESLNVDSFLNSFRRFVALRGKPAHCFSDNETNLTAGQTCLKNGIENWNQRKISDFESQRGIEWSFSPPSAPHFGGVWERLVQSAKRALSVVLGKRSVNEEMFRTILCEFESLMNGRPLTHVSIDPKDLSPLTPNYFLLGRTNSNHSPDVFDDGEIISRRHWRATQAIVDSFWKRWVREYAPTLIERKKWLLKRPNLQVGDVVLVVDDQSPRGEWATGLVIDVRKDKSGTVRSVYVRTGPKTTYHRPVAKLCLLEQTDATDSFSPN